MSARVDLAEFLTAYLAEVDEHLSVASTRVLAIEAALRKGESSPRAVRDLFRALHTVKGLSAMVGVEPVVAIAHRMEAVLRKADRAGGQLEIAAIEPLVEGVRAIGARVRALSEQKPVAAPPGALLAALEAVEAGNAGTTGGGGSLDLDPALGGKLAPFEKQQLLQALAEGRRAVRLEFVPSAERAAAGHSINSVRERLASVAEIVKVLPVALTPSASAPAGLAFVLLLVSSEKDEELARAAGVEVPAVHPIGLTGGLARGASPLPAPPDEDAGADLPDEEEPDRRSVLRVDVARVDDAMEKLAALIVSRSRLARVVSTLNATPAEARDLKQIVTDIARQVRDLRASLLQVRMVRVGEILDRVPLVVRGLRRITNKQVRLEIDAGDAELDKAVAERIFPAILHLVRNAVDHGIEFPEERRAAGKPEEGLVRITASARSNTQLELLVSDDGRG
ncbi:MAG TPA: Hpt domain-containing protein, partial [Polyangiaceae bacterium]